MTVDEILARGWYVDRKSRPWHLRHDGNWQCDLGERKVCLVAAWYMRLLIERDQHRDECEGISVCLLHPVPHVTRDARPGSGFTVFCAHTKGATTGFATASEAMDAARALAVGE